MRQRIDDSDHISNSRTDTHQFENIVASSNVLMRVLAAAESGVISPLVHRCPALPSASNVACVNKCASVMPYPFVRHTSTGGQYSPNDTFRGTNVPSDPSFNLLKSADFIVFDEARAVDILGPAPKLDFIFSSRGDAIHEAPVYVPEIDAIIFSLAHEGIFEQQIIYLNGSVLTIANYTTVPPVYDVNGGKYFNGSVYWAVDAGTTFASPTNASELVTQTPGIYRLDPLTGEVTTLLNNYYGKQFNSPNDLWIQESTGDIFFTDSWYGFAINTTAFPVLPPATWRFRPSTGQTSIVDGSIAQPNGIGISPDGKMMYISDTGVTDFSRLPPPDILPRFYYNSLTGNNLYAFDLIPSEAGSYLINKRSIWAAQEFAVDGFHVAADGYLMGATGLGVDILTPLGELILRIESPYTISNIQFAGPEGKDLWLFGEGGIFRVTWNLRGMSKES